MSDATTNKSGQFGTAPVFMATISTILGAILFLRFGYAVGHVGFWGTIAIVLIGHAVTIPTAMAVAEIATNQKVEGGGAYYMISRSFGLNIGGAIGAALFLAQAISVAFYVIAFAEAFDPVLAFVNATHGTNISDKRVVSIPTMVILSALMLTKGADLGVKALYAVVSVLFVSLVMFMIGDSGYVPSQRDLTATIENPDDFFYVFTIIFPAFTGIAAGLGLSGDLRDPKRSIPAGTLLATVFGLVVYLIIAYKLALSASPEDLAGDQLIMSRIAVWGPAIPIGLGCACISSALGSVLIAPRTLQALGDDKIFPVENLNRWCAKLAKRTNEPFNASVVTCVIAMVFVVTGNVNFVAEIISMFFMVTYGAICLVSCLEHFAADPSYRPTFKSKWYLSAFGAVTCTYLMFKMNLVYAILSLLVMASIYFSITYFRAEKRELAKVFQGVIFQLARRLHVFLQKAEKDKESESWRPSAVCVSQDTFKRFAAFDVLRWIAHRYGFGTYIHYIRGYLTDSTYQESKQILQKLIKLAGMSRSNIYLDTLISPSYTSAIAQIIQLPGISGKDNNMIIVEFAKNDPEPLKDFLDNHELIRTTDFDIGILASSERGFGYRREIHLWITSGDYDNANLMILLGYIILGHPEWHSGVLKIFAMFPADDLINEKRQLLDLVKAGRLQISPKNIQFIEMKREVSVKKIMSDNSADADLVIVGYKGETIQSASLDVFTGYDDLGNILFINSFREKEIK